MIKISSQTILASTLFCLFLFAVAACDNKNNRVDVVNRERTKVPVVATKIDLKKVEASFVNESQAWADSTLISDVGNKQEYDSRISILRTLSVESLLANIDSVRQIKNPTLLDLELFNESLEVLAEKNPVEALELISQGEDLKLWGINTRVFSRILLSLDEPEGFQNILLSSKLFESSKGRSSAVIRDLAAFLAQAPEGTDFSRIKTQLFSGQFGSGYVSTYVRERLNQDPPSLNRILGNMNAFSIPDKFRNVVLQQGIIQISDQDPLMALDLLAQMKGADYSSSASTILASGLKKNDATLKQIIKQFSGTQLLNALSSEEIVRMLDTPEKFVFVSEFVSLLPLTDASSGAISKLCAVLAKHDMQSALRVVQDLPQGRAKTAAVSAIFESQQVDSITEAHKILGELPESLKSDAASGLTRSLVRKGSQDLANALIDSSQPELKSRLIAIQAFQTAALDPVAAASQLESRFQRGEISTSLAYGPVKQISSNMAKFDLEAAKNWTESLDDNLKPAAAEGFIKVWLTVDPISAWRIFSPKE